MITFLKQFGSMAGHNSTQTLVYSSRGSSYQIQTCQ